MRKEFNTLVELMKHYDLYQKDDEVGVALNDLSNKIVEVEKRLTCAINTNKDIRSIKTIYEDVISFDNLEILERSVNDIDIALDLNDTEPIENDWYGLFVEPKLEEPPTDLCKTPQTHEFVKDIIAKLKVINVDGETMQHILKEVGMEEQMLRQLVLTNPEIVTEDLLKERQNLSDFEFKETRRPRLELFERLKCLK